MKSYNYIARHPCFTKLNPMTLHLTDDKLKLMLLVFKVLYYRLLENTKYTFKQLQKVKDNPLNLLFEENSGHGRKF